MFTITERSFRLFPVIYRLKRQRSGWSFRQEFHREYCTFELELRFSMNGLFAWKFCKTPKLDRKTYILLQPFSFRKTSKATYLSLIKICMILNQAASTQLIVRRNLETGSQVQIYLAMTKILTTDCYRCTVKKVPAPKREGGRYSTTLIP